MAFLEQSVDRATTGHKTNECLYYNKKLLRLCGFWPDTHNKRGSKRNQLYYYYSYISPRVSLVRVFYGMFFHVINIAITWGNLFQMVEFFIMLATHISIFVRVATMFFYRDKVKSMFKVLDKLHDPRMMPNDDMKNCVRDCEKIAERFSKVIIYYVPGIVVVSQSLQFIQGLITRTIPLRLWFPYDYRPSPIFEISLFTTMLFTGNDLFLMGVCDVTFISLLLLTIGQFKLLHHKLCNIRHYVDEKIKKRERHSDIGSKIHPPQTPIIEGGEDSSTNHNNNNDGSGDQVKASSSETEAFTPSLNNRERNFEMETYLRHCVKHHQQLLKLTKDLTSVFKFLLAQTVFYSAFGGIGSMYITILAPKVDVKVGAILFLMFLMYADFFVFCWFGNKLSEKAASVRDAVYDCDWFGASESFKRSMRIMISRMNRPVVIKAGGLVLSVGTYRLICRAGYYSHTLLTKLFYGIKINDKRKMKTH